MNNAILIAISAIIANLPRKTLDGNPFIPLTPDDKNGVAWGIIIGKNMDFVRIGRSDGTVYDVRLTDVLGYFVAFIYEEPSTPIPSDGSPRFVGTVTVTYRDDGQVLVRDTKGVDGSSDVELVATTSTYKGEVAPQGETSVETPAEDYFKTNLKRIAGCVKVATSRNPADVPANTRWITIDELLKISHDGRALSALAKAAYGDPVFRTHFIRTLGKL